MIIFPYGNLGQAHQNALDSPTGLITENCSTVVDEVQFDVSSSSCELRLLLFMGTFIVLVLLDNGSICWDNTAKIVLTKLKDQFWIGVIQIIKKRYHQFLRYRLDAGW
jgi:hypothetical protein